MSGQRPYDVIQVADTGSFMMMSSQCLTLGSRRLNFNQIIKAGFPVSSTGMTSSLVEIALKSQCSYSYGFIHGISA
ncbi:hypothetical protein [Wolbachia endosymbiont (group A) of Pogonocherus hispidulus]|uniref:hypothetical protein n=1 Tax=Wolbachia endosymbiont (group A) of Pogonocherus hispidulus TaxID=3066136 RepID=UPI0033425EFA